MKQVRRYCPEEIELSKVLYESQKMVCLSSDVAALESKLRALIDAGEKYIAEGHHDTCRGFIAPFRCTCGNDKFAAAIAKAKGDA